MHTQEQMRNRTKTVTRRLGWKNAKVGVLAVSKSQGRKKGEQPDFFGTIEFTDVRREWLWPVPFLDVAREGFPGMDTEEFVVMFCKHMRCDRATFVTRIQFLFVCELCDGIGGVRVDGNGSWVCALCGACNADTEF